MTLESQAPIVEGTIQLSNNSVKEVDFRQRAEGDIRFAEFVALMASMMALAALSTDTMLPALRQIGLDLGSPSENSNQLIISLLFFGMAFGQLIYGPLSDSVGRKPALYASYTLYFLGSIACIFAPVFWIMLAGRLLQGLGAAGPRGVLTALIRDKYAGRTMARVMSIIMTVFILVPIIAPLFGQTLLSFWGWRAIFVALLLLAVLTFFWFAFRQPETLKDEDKAPLSIRRIIRAFKEVLSDRVALGYTIALGFIQGAFLGYLNSAQQILQIQYGLGSRFAFAFAFLALAMGTASLLNSKLVMQYGMEYLVKRASIGYSILGVLFLAFAYTVGGQPSLWIFMAYLMATFFLTGILFGNMNSMAMEPLGKIAGVGAAVVGSVSTFISAPMGMVVGQSYNGTVIPLVAGFATFGLIATAIMTWSNRVRVPLAQEERT